MKKFIYFLFLVFMVMIVIIGVVRHRNSDKIIDLIVMIPEEASPLDSLNILKVDIELPDRVLKANYYEVNDEAPAIFICMGNSEALFEYLPLQNYLYEKGYSSYVFTYSGFGNSTGEPHETSIPKDTREAYKKFIELTPKAAHRYGLSHSLGATGLLRLGADEDIELDKIVVHAAFSSISDLLVDMKRVPASKAFFWPDIWHNLHAAEDIEIPVLYVHSKNDKTVPYYHSERLAEASEEHGSLRLISGYSHNAIHERVGDEFYDPILEYLEE